MAGRVTMLGLEPSFGFGDRLGLAAGELGEQGKWSSAYRGNSVKLKTGTTFVIDDQVCARAAVKYGKAVNQAIVLAKHIEMVSKRAGRDYEIELSVDETPQPTT